MAKRNGWRVLGRAAAPTDELPVAIDGRHEGEEDLMQGWTLARSSTATGHHEAWLVNAPVLLKLDELREASYDTAAKKREASAINIL